MSAEVKTKIVDTVTTELTKKIVLLLLPLASGLVLAIVPQVRDRILPVLPKPLLAVLLGLSLSLNLALFFYVLHLSRIVNRKLIPRFGVDWDRELTPYCPAHKDIALGAWGRLGTYEPEGFICPGGPHVIQLQDDAGNHLTPVDARKLLRAGVRELPEDAYEPDEIGTKILARLAARPDSKVTLDALANYLRLHPDRVKIILSVLEDRGYLWSLVVPMAPSPPITYHLTDKGRAFLVSKNLI